MLLVDRSTGRPVARSDDVLRNTRAAPDGAGLEGEFQQQMIEMHTAPVRAMEELTCQVRTMRLLSADAAADVGCSVAALGASPFPANSSPAQSQRYSWMQERYGLTARQHLTCALHVHVGVDSAEEGVAVLDRIRIWLPTLLAMNANSPYWAGEDTGFASFRSQLVTRWPSAGPTDVFGSASAYHRQVRELIDSQVILDEGMVYFDARLSHHCPTVEIRVADVSSRAADTVVMAALSRALVETAAREWAEGKPAPRHSSALIRAANWLASRDGLAGSLLDQHTLRPRPAAGVVASLLTHVHKAVDEAGDYHLVVDGLHRILKDGNGATNQRRQFARAGRLADVVRSAIRSSTE